MHLAVEVRFDNLSLFVPIILGANLSIRVFVRLHVSLMAELIAAATLSRVASHAYEINDVDVALYGGFTILTPLTVVGAAVALPQLPSYVNIKSHALAAGIATLLDWNETYLDRFNTVALLLM